MYLYRTQGVQAKLSGYSGIFESKKTKITHAIAHIFIDILVGIKTKNPQISVIFGFLITIGVFSVRMAHSESSECAINKLISVVDSWPTGGNSTFSWRAGTASGCRFCLGFGFVG